jgi:hypothetical protein
MPVIDTFPQRLRSEVERALDGDLEGVFDVGAVRVMLEGRRVDLKAELHQVRGRKEERDVERGKWLMGGPAPSPELMGERGSRQEGGDVSFAAAIHRSLKGRGVF